MLLAHPFKSFIMFAVPDAMSRLNSYVYQDIPSAKDLYTQMGFRYVNGLGHTDVSSAQDSAPCITHVNASIDVACTAQRLLHEDIITLEKQSQNE